MVAIFLFIEYYKVLLLFCRSAPGLTDPVNPLALIGEDRNDKSVTQGHPAGKEGAVSSVDPLPPKAKAGKLLKTSNKLKENKNNKGEGKTFHLLLTQISNKTKVIKTQKSKGGKDYLGVNSPIDSNEDNKKEYDESNMDDYLTDFEPKYFSLNNHKDVESNKSQQTEIMINNNKNTSSRDVKSGEFKANVSVINRSEESDTSDSSKVNSTTEKILIQEKSTKIGTNQTGSNQGKNNRNVELKGIKQSDEDEPETGDAKVIKQWILWRGGIPGFWHLNRNTVRLRS